jgi:hypothetical protein
VVVVAELSTVPVYQLLFGATMWDQTPCFAFQYTYPPSPLALMRPDGVMVPLVEFARLSLMRLPVAFAESTKELDRICKAANEAETLENALSRVPEAFNLFNNGPRVRKDDVDRTGKEANEVVAVAWKVREWVLTGCKDEQVWDAIGTRLVGQP